MLSIIEQCRADGVTLDLKENGRIRARGGTAALARWKPQVQARRAEVAALLAGEAKGLLRETDRLLRDWLIDGDDAAAARASIVVQCRNPGCLAEWRTLLRWCAQARPGPSGAN